LNDLALPGVENYAKYRQNSLIGFENMANPRRDDLVETALKLFYTGGFNATGIDKILGESGVAKMTLYNHFRSKDELILAALRRRDEKFRNWLMGEMKKAGPDPRAQILAMFDALEDWFKGRAFKEFGFYGCAFINAASEFGDQKHPAHRLAAEHKQSVVDHLEQICRKAGAAAPLELAEQIALIKEGAIATAHVRGMPEAALNAKRVAAALMDAALGADGPNDHA
jgi:AcrR family transcriptional regulator